MNNKMLAIDYDHLEDLATVGSWVFMGVFYLLFCRVVAFEVNVEYGFPLIFGWFLALSIGTVAMLFPFIVLLYVVRALLFSVLCLFYKAVSFFKPRNK